MQTEAIIATLLSAAAFLKEPVKTVVSQSVKDIYDTAKYYLRRKLGVGTEAAKALDFATEKPDSEARKSVLLEETARSGLDADIELVRLIEQLAALLPKATGGVGQQVSVTGRNNMVQVAGRDLIATAKHVHRNVITPDGRHLTVEQRKKVRALIAAFATRIADEGGTPAFGAVHSMIQRRFSVASYLLLPRDKVDDALGFLRQQCAIYRPRLRHRNPISYQNDFFRAIHARRERLGWDRPRLYQFAAVTLGMKKPPTSLRELGSNQLKSLDACMRRYKENTES